VTERLGLAVRVEPGRAEVIAQMGGEVIRDYETLALLAKKS
jgi:hypothetical protein